VQIFAWLATLAHGRPRLSLPMLYIFGMLFVFAIGGLTGVMLAIVPFNLQAHDTHFVVAHLHYVLIGGFVLPMIGAAYYWLPHLTGRRPSRYMSVIAFWMTFAGFNLTFLAMHLTGLRGMPRRVHTYLPEVGWDGLNLLSSVGSFLMAMGFAAVALDLVLLMRFAPRSARNPWRATTLDWAMPIPPPPYNFASLPRIDRRGDMLDPNKLAPELAAGRGYLACARRGQMETLGVDMLTGRVDQLIVLPRQSYLPLVTALVTGTFFLAVLLKAYWVALLALAGVVACFLRWTGDTGLAADTGPVAIGCGEVAPPHAECDDPPSWWAMAFTLAADTTLYASLLFGGAFLWVSAPRWPPSVLPNLGLAAPAMAAASAVVAMAAGRTALRQAGGQPIAALVTCAAAHGVAAALIAAIAFAILPQATVHALPAVVVAVLIYLAAHHALGAVLALFGVARVRAGRVSARRALDLRIGRQWHDYCVGATLVGLLFLFALVGIAGSGAPR
jgi:cytochrome c oxidase subunit I+III